MAQVTVIPYDKKKADRGTKRRHLATVCWHKTTSETGSDTRDTSTAGCPDPVYYQQLI